MEVRKKKVRRKEKGFTLVELMIVIAIIAILAAVAISQYSAYKNKAKAKELVGFARACAMEIASQCQVEPNLTQDDANNLESCSVDNTNTKYLTDVSVNIETWGGCNGSTTVNATGTIAGSSNNYYVSCTYNGTSQDLSCISPRKI